MNALTIIMIFALLGCASPTSKPSENREGKEGGKNGSGSATRPSSSASSPANAPFGMAQFAYIVSDEAGTAVIKGTMILPWPPPVNGTFNGTWQAKYSSNDDVSPANKLGPQTGGGACAGELSNGRLRINLNPGTNDNNVFFTLVIGESELKGEWTYSTFTGPTGKGSVEARRE